MRLGITLVEIAIVLVIAAIIVGAVVMGRDAIRAAELRGAQSEVAQIKSAISVFQTKYGGLPGDITNASQYWGDLSNGDGDGTIDYNNGALGEEYYAWAQLGKADLIKGYYTGLSTTSLPPSSVRAGYYRVSYKQSIYSTTAHMISLNAMNLTYNLANLAVLSPSDVYSMDLKSDDGKADSGTIMGFNEEGVSGCADHDYTFGSGTYLTTSTSKKCKVFFVIND